MALDREAMPSLLTPPFDHIPSIPGTHFLSKAMRAFSFNIGLIRQRLFHGIPCILMLIIYNKEWDYINAGWVCQQGSMACV